MEGTTKLGQTSKRGFSPTDSVVDYFLLRSEQLVMRKLDCQNMDAMNFHQTE